MKVRSWKRPCRPHGDNILSGPLNGRSADFLIHGINKPQTDFVVDSNHADISDDQLGLPLELLDLVYQKQITTISNILPPCRLNFSRELKSALDNVIAKNTELHLWLHLLLLPVCTLNLYVPNNASESRSCTRKKLHIAAINQSLVEWGQPNGCVNIVQRLLELDRQNEQRQ